MATIAAELSSLAAARRAALLPALAALACLAGRGGLRGGKASTQCAPSPARPPSMEWRRDTHKNTHTHTHAPMPLPLAARRRLSSSRYPACERISSSMR